MRTLPPAITTRQAVLAETFAIKGLDETRMEDLAQAAGIPKATLYYHFAGKEEILWLLRSWLAARPRRWGRQPPARVPLAGAWREWYGLSYALWPSVPRPHSHR